MVQKIAPGLSSAMHLQHGIQTGYRSTTQAWCLRAAMFILENPQQTP